MPEEIIANSESHERAAIRERTLRCLDPKIATVYSYKDEGWDLVKRKIGLSIRFEYCLDLEPIEGVTCLGYDEAEKWFLGDIEILNMFEIRTRVDYSSISDYWI